MELFLFELQAVAPRVISGMAEISDATCHLRRWRKLVPD